MFPTERTDWKPVPKPEPVRPAFRVDTTGEVPRLVPGYPDPPAAELTSVEKVMFLVAVVGAVLIYAAGLLGWL